MLIAARFSHLAVVEALVKVRAAANQGTANGSISLFIAAQEGHLAVVKTLLIMGAAVDKATPGRFPPVHAHFTHAPVRPTEAPHYPSPVRPVNSRW